MDIILFGTGCYPYVPCLQIIHHKFRMLTPLTSCTITPSRIPGFYLQILYAHNPTLAFTGATVSFIPILLADLTSTWIVLAWSRTIPVSTASRKD